MRRLPRARSVGSDSGFGRNNLVTTTYAYDNNGNLTQKTTDGWLQIRMGLCKIVSSRSAMA
jgi:hypothetical protein